MTACEDVNSSVPKPAAVPTIKPLVECIQFKYL
jgi:hypothetical protein